MKTRFLFLMAVCFLAVTTAMAQITVKGQVLSSTDGEGLIGAAVQEVGTTNGAVTDYNGNFSLKVKEGASLKISYVGYIPQTLKAKANMVITLKEDTKALDDVVVIGYGVQKKSDLTGAVASVKEADLMNRSTTDAASALQGKVAGLQIINSSGAPGEEAQIRVRGYSSNGSGNGPLIVVDGLKVDNISYLDPGMIESIEVLKDAASAAIYGVEAGNGVVLVTTKTAKAGHTSITYDAKFINQSLAKKAELFDGDGYVEYQKYIGKLTDEILANRGYEPGMNYNWYDQVFEPTWAQQHSITFQGGNEKGHFLAAINYAHNNGIVKGDKDVYNRLSGMLNADYQIKDWLKIGTTNTLTKMDSKSVSQRGFGSSLNSVVSLDPLTPDYYDTYAETPAYFQQHYPDEASALRAPNGKYYGTSLYLQEATGSPLFQRDRTDASNEGFNLRGTAYLDFTPFKGFVFTSRFGYRIGHNNVKSYQEPYWLTPMASDVNYTLSAQNNTNYYYQWENFANYTKTFAEKHNFGAMIGMSWTEHHIDNMSVSANGTNILKGYAENYRYPDYFLDDVKKSVGNAPSDNRNLAYFGRVTYNYDNKYYVQANFRADAYDSSKLDKSERWGYFPAFSAGWTISNEKFFKDIVNTDVFNFLKLRTSWGRNGNINSLSGYQYSSSVNLNSQWYQYNVDASTQTYGTAPEDKQPNPNLVWESSKQFDLGLDARFLNNRLTFTFDYYHKTTEDLLLQYTPVPEAGFKNGFMNAGKIMNEGFEFELGWRDQIGELQYSVNANAATLKNEVLKLNPQVTFINGTGGGVSGLNYKVMTRVEEGQPLWFFRGFDFVGVNPETGKPIYTDINGNRTETITDGDAKYIGSAIPTFNYGLTINLAYKGFDFTLFGTGASGAKIFSLMYSADRLETNTLKTFFENSWRNPGDNAKYPDMRAVASDWYFWSSSASLFSANYFKIKQIQLGYTLPKSITKKFACENLRVYASLDDFITFTSYPGADPEVAGGHASGRHQDSGYDSGVYPTSKKFVLGLNITF